jgi:hypothetical protein
MDMTAFLSNLWLLLCNIYHAATAYGYPGCAAVFAAGWMMLSYGERLSGTPENMEGHFVGNRFYVNKHNAAVPGTGKGPVDWLIAVFCKLSGSLLLMDALFALVNVLMHGPANH